MKGKTKTAPGKQFVRITRDVLESSAWQGLGINARRFVDFLMLEHLRHGGRHNGYLKAPHRQLVAFGISAGLVADAIVEVEAAGVIECHRGGNRVATTFGLAWLPAGQPPAKIRKSATSSGGSTATTSGGRFAKSATTSGGR